MARRADPGMAVPRSDSQALKARVAHFWDANPCESFAATARPGERAFFEQVERFRYASQPYMRDLIGFDRFADKRLLEVGCGLGIDLRQFALGGARVVGLDLSANSVALARQHFRTFDTDGQFVNSDSELLPFADKSFDVVYSFGVLHHTPDTQAAIDDCWRVLKPGGRFIVMLYNRRSWAVVVEPYLLAAKRRLSRRSLPPHPTDSSEVVRRYDGGDNPLGKAFTPKEVHRMLRNYVDVQMTMRESRFRGDSWLVQSYGRLIQWSGIERKWGFWIVAQATRPDGQREGG